VRILCVDDHATNRTILEDQLTAWGLQVDCVADGHTALARLQAAQIDGQPYTLAILDYQMPGMDGLELARLIKAEPMLAPIRLVILSSMGQQQPSHRTAQADIAAYLTKPVRQSHLYNCLRSVMGVSAAPTVAHRREETRVQIHARVLLAEDNVVNQRVALSILEKIGCRGDIASTGREAITMLAQHAYDIVLMDCQMPEMDGSAATAIIRKHEASAGQHIPIVAMTANAMQGDRERCLAAGMDDYLSKPVRFSELITILQKWVRSQAEPPSQPDFPVTDETQPTLPPVPPSSPLDAEAFAALKSLESAEDPGFLRSVVEQFVQDTTAHLTTLHLAVNTGDAVALERAAHTLKSTSASMGALKMSMFCHELQVRGREKSVADATGYVEQLQDEFARVQHALAQACPYE
jgi:CheY-like chemotaxis protein/HPt (histidine-containing phosphotransfer) domain-containing protein